jgi:hypothetical protein
MLKKLIAPILVAGTLSVGAAAPATAQTFQRGLVNINIGDVVLQVPIAVAANVCDVNVAALVGDFADFGEADCDAFAESGATVTPAPPGGGPVVQEGLVNVNIGDVTVQIPITLAANICDVNIAVLVGEFVDTGGAECDAEARGNASG